MIQVRRLSVPLLIVRSERAPRRGIQDGEDSLKYVAPIAVGVQPRLKFKSLLNDPQVHVKIVLGVAIKSLERAFGLLDVTLFFQNPRRLGAQG